MSSGDRAQSPVTGFQPARFWAVDLHVHTPASADVIPSRYGATTPEEIVQAALAAHLDAIAITDHNTVAWCDDVARAANETALTVLPGAEITTSEGHLLAIWAEATDLACMQDVLTQLEIDRKQQGNIKVSSPKGMTEVAKRVSKAGGLAIAAHVERDRGVLRNQAADQIRRILLTPELAALEITEPGTPDRVEQMVGAKRVCAYVQNSDVYPPGGDSHQLSAIGHRRTWMKASRPDILGISHALKDPSLRVRLEEPEGPTHCWIKTVKVQGGFFDGHAFNFSSDLNCLLGGTGTGKSLALELVRFALDDQTDELSFEKVREEVDCRLQSALGTDSSVEVTLALHDDDLIVRRTFDAQGSPPPEVISGHGDEDFRRRGLIRAFSQGEVIEYAREPVGRLQLIDDALELEPVEDEIEEVCSLLDTNGEKVCDVEDEIARSEAELKKLPTTQERVKELSGLFKADVVQNQASWAKEGRYFKDPTALIDTAEEVAIETNAAFEHEPEITDNADLYGRAKEVIDTYTGRVAAAAATIAQAREQALKDLKSISDEWHTRFKAFEQALSDELAKVDDEERDLEVLRRRLQQLQSEEQELKEIRKKLDQVHRPELSQLLTERERLIDRLVKARRDRRQQRRKRIDVLNDSMSGAVQISLREEVDATGFGREIARLARGSRLSQAHRQLLEDQASPLHFVRSFIREDAHSVAGATGVPEQRIQVLFDHVRERGSVHDFLNLQAMEIGDALRVRFKRPGTDTYEDIERLAHGEKCTAILIIAMAEGTEPLIIDQPEDALHAPWIEEHLVWRLRELRGRRQYMFATRSPGIVVSADAEMIVTLRADVKQGELVACGSLERHDLNELALYHLEGGAEPFRRRADKFSPSLSPANS